VSDSAQARAAAMQPFAVDLFKGMLAFFLLDMGLLAARNFGKLKGHSPWLVVYAIAGPVVHACIALAVAMTVDMSPGNGGLLMVLAASASPTSPCRQSSATPSPKPTPRSTSGCRWV